MVHRPAFNLRLSLKTARPGAFVIREDFSQLLRFRFSRARPLEREVAGSEDVPEDSAIGHSLIRSER